MSDEKLAEQCGLSIKPGEEVYTCCKCGKETVGYVGMKFQLSFKPFGDATPENWGESDDIEKAFGFKPGEAITMCFVCYLTGMGVPRIDQ